MSSTSAPSPGKGLSRRSSRFLDYLKELGITAVELMPVAQFPGDRNWGYDGVYPSRRRTATAGPTA